MIETNLKSTAQRATRVGSTDPVRRWFFTVEDWDGNEEHVCHSGHAVTEAYAKSSAFIGTDKEASEEADRRANKWEGVNDELAAKVTCHSMGVVSNKEMNHDD